jgi:hypothetical protein
MPGELAASKYHGHPPAAAPVYPDHAHNRSLHHRAICPVTVS